MDPPPLRLLQEASTSSKHHAFAQAKASAQVPAATNSSVKATAPLAVRERDSQELRVCALVLSVLAFFLFIAAEIVPPERAPTLVALGTLGFAWIGPLTLLAGTIMWPRFRWWQPFRGGAEFVWMQALGWSLHTLVVTAAIVVLANDRMDKWIEGQYLLLGIAGFVAQLLLNLSIGCFREQEAEYAAVRFAWHTKAVVSMLISFSGALLYVVFELAAPRLQSNAVIIVGCAEFVLSALMLHVFYGCKDIPGYRIWQPFEGERTFLLLQYLGWQFFAAAIVGTMMLCSSSDFTSLHPVSRGASTAVGCMGFISQVVLLLSLHHFSDSGLDRSDASSTASARSRGRRQPREVYVSGLLCVGAIIVGCVSYVARLPQETVLSASAQDAWLKHEKVLWTISIVALGIACPIANMGAVRTFPHYYWWQPFIGGTKYVFLQTIGWLWYGFFCSASIVLSLNDGDFAEYAAPFALFVGCLATSAIVLSLSYFRPPARSSSSPDEDPTVPCNGVPWKPQTSAYHGEIAISLLMTLSSIGCHVFADCFRDSVGEAVRVLALAAGTMLFSLGCAITHSSGRRLYTEYRLFQPFEGGARFVVRQAVGWTLFAVQLLFDTLVASVPAHCLPFGVTCMVGAYSLIPHLVIISSIRYFRPTRVTSTSSSSSSSSHAPTERLHASETTWLHLVKRPDLRWLLIVSSIVTCGSLLLFGAAEIFRENTRFRHADEVFYGFGCVLSMGGLLFTHCGLGPRVRPGYRFFQPFRGGLRFITFQGVGWTLASVAWVVASTAFYWRTIFFQLPAIHLLTGTLFGVAQCILVYSLPLFEPPQTLPNAGMLCVQLAWLDKLTQKFNVGPLVGMSACVVFVLVDISMLYCGPSLPVFPITVCAVLALFSAIPMSYKFARSAMGEQAKVLGGSVVFLVLGTALWSFTILLGALFCCRVWGLEARSVVMNSTAFSSSTNFMGTFTGGLGFAAQLVFFRASDSKPGIEATSRASKAVLAARRAKEHLVSTCIWLYSTAAIVTGLICAYTTSMLPRQLPTHQCMGVAACSLAVIGCAYWIQRQILSPDDASKRLEIDHDVLLPESVLARMESDCFAQVAAFLTVAELICVSSTCKSFQCLHTEGFWRRQYIARFSPRASMRDRKEGEWKRAHARLMGRGNDAMELSEVEPRFIAPFAATWMTTLEETMLNAICRLDVRVANRYVPQDSQLSRSNKWRTLCLSKENNCWCEQCQVCLKLEIVIESGRQWETQQSCKLRIPSTWVQVCSCVDPVTFGYHVAHRACLEREHQGNGNALSGGRVKPAPCHKCHGAPRPSFRYPSTMGELCRVSWLDFREGREDFGGGFFSFVPMAVSLVVLSAHSFNFGCCALHAWVVFAMALCFVSNTPRLSRSLDRIGDETNPSFIAYSRLFHTLSMSSFVHIVWCLSASPLGVLDLLLGLNFVFFILVSCTVLLLYWRTSYRIDTFDACATPEQLAAAADHRDWIGGPGSSACVACLLQLCSEYDA